MIITAIIVIGIIQGKYLCITTTIRGTFVKTKIKFVFSFDLM